MNISGAALLAQAQRARHDWPFIEPTEAGAGLPQYLLYAVGSRETNLTNELGDNDHGHGVWQLDDRSHRIPPGFDGDVSHQAQVAAGMLVALFQRWGDWTAACNAYNSGRPGNAGTTGGDYGPDVMARRLYLTQHLAPPTPPEDDLTPDEHNLIVRLEAKIDAITAALEAGLGGRPIGGVVAIVENKSEEQGLDLGKIKNALHVQ